MCYVMLNLSSKCAVCSSKKLIFMKETRSKTIVI